MNTPRLFAGFAVAVMAAVLSTGCATVTRGTKDVLVVESTPSGAKVTVDGQVGRTPTSFKLSRKFEGPVLIEKEGYEPVNVQVHSSPSGAGGAGMAGNVLVGGLIGAGIDAGFGSTNDLSPNPINVTLVLRGTAQTSAAPAAPAAPEAPAAMAVAPEPVAAPEPTPAVMNTSAEAAPETDPAPKPGTS